MSLRFGEANRNVFGTSNQQMRKVKKVYMHPQYSFPENDIAILEVGRYCV